jgi:coenzyme F420-reducing hydrogenase beta subunit
MRALDGMIKRDAGELNQQVHRSLLTISVDCLGTYPAGDFLWRAERRGSAESLSSESLQFARQGGIMSYRYRSACQVCSTPEARSADINIGVLGLPVREYLLVSARDERIAASLGLEKLTDAVPDPEVLVQRDRMLSKINERNYHTRQRIWSALADTLLPDIPALTAHFEQCGDCQACMDICPICEVDYPQRGEDGRFAYKDILSWMVSCAGCGMCEQSCPSHQPLSTIFSFIRERLVDPNRPVGEVMA